VNFSVLLPVSLFFIKLDFVGFIRELMERSCLASISFRSFAGIFLGGGESSLHLVCILGDSTRTLDLFKRS